MRLRETGWGLALPPGHLEHLPWLSGTWFASSLFQCLSLESSLQPVTPHGHVASMKSSGLLSPPTADTLSSSLASPVPSSSVSICPDLLPLVPHTLGDSVDVITPTTMRFASVDLGPPNPSNLTSSLTTGLHTSLPPCPLLFLTHHYVDQADFKLSILRTLPPKCGAGIIGM